MNRTMKRLKKILKWTGVALGAFVAVGLIVNAWFIWSTDSRLAEQLEEIRAAGEPLTLAELAREPIPPEQNAATYLQQAEAENKAMNGEIYATNWYVGWDTGGFEPLPALPEEGARLVKEAFAAHPKVLQLLKRAGKCPSYDAKLDYSLPQDEFFERMAPIIHNLRGFSRILHLRARVLASEGDCDEAVRTGLLMFSLVKFSYDNSTLVSYYLANTIQGLAVDAINFALQAGPVSDDVRNELNAELDRQEQFTGYLPVVITERPFLIDAFRSVPGRNFWLYKRGYWNEQESGCLEMLKTMAALAETPMPYRESLKILLDTPAKYRDSIMLDESYPISKVYQIILTASAKKKAKIRSLRVLNALQMQTSAYGDKTPKLSELGLPDEATTDPFTGEPLHIKKLPQGWVVYSVGRNFNDDGGSYNPNPNHRDIVVGPTPAATAEKK